jgi:hypothetical protein
VLSYLPPNSEVATEPAAWVRYTAGVVGAVLVWVVGKVVQLRSARSTPPSGA